MASQKKDIGKLLRKYGYAFPKSSDEVRSFEGKYNKADSLSPKNWPDILSIIKSRNNTTPVFNIREEENSSSKNLSMAAREGKGISKEDRDQMNKDKKNARKK